MKTVKEGLNDAYKKAGHNAYFGNGFKAGVEFSQRWIDVNDELPQQGDLVLVKYTIISGCSDITLLELSYGNTWHCRGVDFRRPKAITHWRPIEYK